MDFSLTLLNLAGSVALLLWGVHMVSTGVQRAFGARLRAFLASTLRNRFKAFLAGMGVTALLQSSTATGLMITGFAASGMVELVPALAVMLGANVGTTLIVQVLSFDVSEIAPALILVGYLLFRRASAGPRDFGRVLIGLGLLLFALHRFVEVLAPYEDDPSLRLLLGAIATQPVVDVILAAGLTWAAHSSVAVVLVIMSFAAQGTVPPLAAFALVLGANIGTAITPVLEGASGDDPAARRLPIGNLLTRVSGVICALAVLPFLGRLMVTVEPNNARAVADFHTAFNVALALIFMPLLNSMLVGLRDTLEKGDRKQIGDTRRMDHVLDKLNVAITTYVTSLDTEAFSDDDVRRAREVLSFATNLAQAGDVLDRNLNIVSKLSKRGQTFSEAGRTEIHQMIDRLITNTKTSASLFLTGDERAARLLASEKQEFRAMQSASIDGHFERLRSRNADTAETNAMHLDTLRDLKTVNSHIVAASTYPVLENRDGLPPSRVQGTE